MFVTFLRGSEGLLGRQGFGILDRGWSLVHFLIDPPYIYVILNHDMLNFGRFSVAKLVAPL